MKKKIGFRQIKDLSSKFVSEQLGQVMKIALEQFKDELDRKLDESKVSIY